MLYYFGCTRNTCVDRSFISLQIVSLTIYKMLYMSNLMKKKNQQKKKEEEDSVGIHKVIYIVTINIDNINCLIFMTIYLTVPLK